MLQRLEAETAAMTAFADVLGHALGIVPANYTDAEVIKVHRCKIASCMTITWPCAR